MKTAYPLSGLLRSGKINTDFEVGDQYVTGICLLYPERSSQEHEYMVKEKSLVLLEQSSLSECVQRAKDLAYQAAISRLSGMAALGTEPAQEDAFSLAPAEKHPAAPILQKPAVPSRTEGSFAGEEADPADPSEEPEKESGNGSLSQIGFGDLRPASSLLRKETQQPAQEVCEPEEENALEKARNTPITILGKAHLCNGWTAGKILEEHPEIIVDFAHRYSGPKVEQKQALEALYSEALRRVQKAA